MYALFVLISVYLYTYMIINMKMRICIYIYIHIYVHRVPQRGGLSITAWLVVGQSYPKYPHIQSCLSAEQHSKLIDLAAVAPPTWVVEVSCEISNVWSRGPQLSELSVRIEESLFD